MRRTIGEQTPILRIQSAASADPGRSAHQPEFGEQRLAGCLKLRQGRQLRPGGCHCRPGCWPPAPSSLRSASESGQRLGVPAKRAQTGDRLADISWMEARRQVVVDQRLGDHAPQAGLWGVKLRLFLTCPRVPAPVITHRAPSMVPSGMRPPSAPSSTRPTTRTSRPNHQSPCTMSACACASEGACGIRASKSWTNR